MPHSPAACLRAALSANAPARPCQACEAVAAELVRENPRLAGALRRLGFLRGKKFVDHRLQDQGTAVCSDLTRNQGARP